MSGYVLYKDGSYFKFKDSNKIPLKHAAIVMLEIKSYLFGTAYLKVSPKSFKKIKNISNVRLNYDFYDGQVIDDTDDITVHNKYYYKNASQLFSKIADICISEDVLSDSMWVHDCYVCYAFDNIRIRYLVGKNKYSYDNISDFYNDIGFYDKDTDDYYDNYEFITLSNSRWRNRRSYRKLKKNKTFVYYGESIYFEIDKKFYDKIKELKFSTFVRIYEYDGMDEQTREEFDEIFNETMMTYEYHRSKKDTPQSNEKPRKNNLNGGYSSSSIHNLLQARFGSDVIAQLESSNEVYYYRLHSVIDEINGKKSKGKETRLNKFVNKYFKSIPDSTDDDITSNYSEYASSDLDIFEKG